MRYFLDLTVFLHVSAIKSELLKYAQKSSLIINRPQISQNILFFA